MRRGQCHYVGAVWADQCGARRHAVLPGTGGHMDAGVAQQRPEAIEDRVAGCLQAGRGDVGSAWRHNDVDAVEYGLDGHTGTPGKRLRSGVTFAAYLRARRKKGLELRTEAVRRAQALWGKGRRRLVAHDVDLRSGQAVASTVQINIDKLCSLLLK